ATILGCGGTSSMSWAYDSSPRPNPATSRNTFNGMLRIRPIRCVDEQGMMHAVLRAHSYALRPLCPQHLLHRRHQRHIIKAAFRVELLLRAVLDKSIGDAEALHLGVVAVVGHELQHGAAHAAHDAAVLHGDHVLELSEDLMQQQLVDGLREAHVVVGNAVAFRLQAVDALGGDVADVPDGEHGDVIAGAHFATGADGDLLEGRFPLSHHAFAARVANAEGA